MNRAAASNVHAAKPGWMERDDSLEAFPADHGRRRSGVIPVRQRPRAGGRRGELAHRPGAYRDRLCDRRRRLPAHPGAVRRIRGPDRHRLRPAGEKQRRLPRPGGVCRRRLDLVWRLFALAGFPRRQPASVDRFRLDVRREAQRPRGARFGRTDAARGNEAADRRGRGRASARRQGAVRVPRPDPDRPAGVRHELGLPAGLARRRSDHPERGGRALTLPPRRWSPSVVVLHWINAALIIGLLAVGWLMTHAVFDAAATFNLYQWHKSLGFSALALTALRIAARLRRPAPDSVPGWEGRP